MHQILRIGQWMVEWDGEYAIVSCNGPLQTSTHDIESAVAYVMDRVTPADIRQHLVELAKENYAFMTEAHDARV
jgi:hypothetical protein